MKCTVPKKSLTESPKCRRSRFPNLHIYNGLRIRVPGELKNATDKGSMVTELSESQNFNNIHTTCHKCFFDIILNTAAVMRQAVHFFLDTSLNWKPHNAVTCLNTWKRFTLLKG